jgi:chemotaxis protein methyltransferase CheR
MVYSRLSRRLRETRPPELSPSTCSWLERTTGAEADAEWQEFVNCLTTNLTAFFREEHHFHALVEDLRQRAARRCASGATPRPPARSPTRWP